MPANTVAPPTHINISKDSTDIENKENMPDGGHSQNSAQPEDKPLKDPKPRAGSKRKNIDEKEPPATEPPKKKSPRGKISKKDDKNVDISSVHIDGEEKEAVPIYDTCNEIRRKIKLHLKSNVTKAAFTRDISQCAYGDNSKVTTRQLNAFLDKKGPTGGAESPVFYAAYVYFEKLRIAQGKGKTKLRQEMEREWGAKGMDRVDDGKHGVICHASERPYTDKYGKLRIEKR